MTDAIRELFELLTKKEKSGSDYTGTVTRVDGKTAYVQFDGSDITDTPVALSIGAKSGDSVRVRVADGRAWMIGNDTAPPNDSSEVASDLQVTNYNLTVAANKTENVASQMTNLEAAYSSFNRVVTNELVAHRAVIDQLDATYANITLANIDTANINTASIKNLFTQVGLIRDAVVDGARITGYLDAVKINAASIDAGTLSVNRLVIRGSTSSIVYAINNISGALQSQNVNTINGEVLTDRTILADKIVAHTITANEITAANIVGTGGWINLAQGTFNYGDGALSWNGSALTVSGHITTTSGKIGPWTLNNNGLRATGFDLVDGLDTGYYMYITNKQDTSEVTRLYSNTLSMGALSPVLNTVVLAQEKNGSTYYGRLNLISSASQSIFLDASDGSGGFSGNVTVDGDFIGGLRQSTIGSGLTNHADSLRGYFNSNKSTVPRNKLIAFYDTCAQTGSVDFGYFLYGYDSAPYGGFFSAHYDKAYYVGISSGTFTQQQILTHTNYTSFVSSVRDSANGNATTFSYGSAGLAYDDYTWLAAWNGYQLRAVNKSQFLASTGGTLSGALTISSGHFIVSAGHISSRHPTDAYTYALNSTTNCYASCRAESGGNHGLYSNGYWNGSSFVSSGKYLIYRNTYGNTCMASELYTYNEGYTTQRPVVGTNAGTNAVGVIVSNTASFGIYGRWAGGASANMSGRTISCPSSDIRLKENIKDSEADALSVINAIRMRQFDWKDKSRGHWDCGMVVDEMEKDIDPKLCIGGGEDEEGNISYKSVDTFYLQGYEIKAIQELYTYAKALEKEIIELKRRIA